MVFSSNLFLLVFLPIFLIIYWLLPYKAKNAWALAASLAFYSWGAPLFVFVLMASSLFDFLLVKYLFETKHRKLGISLGLIGNVGLLLYFKYANFFIDNFNDSLELIGMNGFHWTKVILPIGISFFTFQKISYLVDVYRGTNKALSSYFDHLLFVVLFPQLIAGPIVRYHDIAQELTNRRKNLNADNRLLGMSRFAIGLAKKVFLANVFGSVADETFGMENWQLTSDQAWVGAFAYTFQIYFDFSAYSDMAIGLGRIMGFHFPENFNNPYVANSITDFWRRWHISLSSWMRDYLYIPLGGNRKGELRTYSNLWTVFIISGFWHGAAWTFVIWGVYHGFWLVAERLFLNKLLKRLPNILRIAITFILVIVGWVIFRAESMNQAIFFLQKMFAFEGGNVNLEWSFKLALIAAIIFSFWAIWPRAERIQMNFYSLPKRALGSLGLFAISVLSFLLCVSQIASTDFNPFIYFRF